MAKKFETLSKTNQWKATSNYIQCPHYPLLCPDCTQYMYDLKRYSAFELPQVLNQYRENMAHSLSPSPAATATPILTRAKKKSSSPSPFLGFDRQWGGQQAPVHQALQCIPSIDRRYFFLSSFLSSHSHMLSHLILHFFFLYVN